MKKLYLFLICAILSMATTAQTFTVQNYCNVIQLSTSGSTRFYDKNDLLASKTATTITLSRATITGAIATWTTTNVSAIAPTIDSGYKLLRNYINDRCATSGGGGGINYLSNGLYFDGDTGKLGGTLTGVTILQAGQNPFGIIATNNSGMNAIYMQPGLEVLSGNTGDYAGSLYQANDPNLRQHVAGKSSDTAQHKEVGFIASQALGTGFEVYATGDGSYSGNIFAMRAVEGTRVTSTNEYGGWSYAALPFYSGRNKYQYDLASSDFVLINVPTYSDEAAALSDTDLPTGALYKLTGTHQLYIR